MNNYGKQFWRTVKKEFEQSSERYLCPGSFSFFLKCSPQLTDFLDNHNHVAKFLEESPRYDNLFYKFPICVTEEYLFTLKHPHSKLLGKEGRKRERRNIRLAFLDYMIENTD